MRITLVCTVHNEMGLCNEHQLIRILEAVSPDVIFEEIRPSDFDLHYGDAARHTLEMRAVRKHVAVRPARQVPVDEYIIPSNFRSEVDVLFDCVERNGIEYRALVAERAQKAHLLGFGYLNSPQFAALAKRIREALEATIVGSRRDDLNRVLSTWNGELRRRDESMLDNIYAFCRTSSFAEGVFLVGAGHMSSIIDGVERRMKTEATPVAWNTWTGPS